MEQFQLENLFKNLLAALGQKVPWDYKRVVRDLLHVLQLEDGGDKLQRLHVLAYIRNSLHSNGVHLGKDSVIDIDHIGFEFMHGQIVRCASWDHVVHAWLDVLATLRAIFYHPSIADIDEVVPSAYVQV